jgi:hypothetical protein
MIPYSRMKPPVETSDQYDSKRCGVSQGESILHPGNTPRTPRTIFSSLRSRTGMVAEDQGAGVNLQVARVRRI